MTHHGREIGIVFESVSYSHTTTCRCLTLSNVVASVVRAVYHAVKIGIVCAVVHMVIENRDLLCKDGRLENFIHIYMYA